MQNITFLFRYFRWHLSLFKPKYTLHACARTHTNTHTPSHTHRFTKTHAHTHTHIQNWYEIQNYNVFWKQVCCALSCPVNIQRLLHQLTYTSIRWFIWKAGLLLPNMTTAVDICYRKFSFKVYKYMVFNGTACLNLQNELTVEDLHSKDA